ncbi:MAG: hypothetical protein ACRELY_16075 [Polyangiaceae bacterium]
MSTPQDSPRKHKLKVRRAKQLAAWRTKNPKKASGDKGTQKAPAKKATAAKK